jgi:thiol-disulfide isomerase/thioredoxin
MKSKSLMVTVLLLGTTAFAQVKKGDRAADFSATTLGGQTLKLSALRGKVVLVDFWASWCEPCKKELPLLARMAPRLKAKGIEIVAVNIDDNKQNAEAFVRQHGLALTVGKYEPPKMPTSFLVDRSGVVRAINDGFEPGDEGKLEQQLTSLAK